jgi:hypothetical protein
MRRYAAPLLLLIVVAVAGFVLARSGSSSSHPVTLNRTATATGFSVRYFSDWTMTSPTEVPGVLMGGADVLGLAPSTGSGIATGDQLTLGTSRAPAGGTLPAALTEALSGSAHAATVMLGGRPFSRYLDLHIHGRSGVTSLYLLATTRDTIAAACVTPSAGDPFTARCEQVLATLQLPAAVKVRPALSTTYAAGLNRALGSLDKVRAKDGPGLKAKSVPARARAASQLAEADAGAAKAIGSLAAGPAHAANRSLAAALRAEAADDRALAAAAQHGKRPAYAAATRHLRRNQQRLSAAFKALAALGYQQP